MDEQDQFVLRIFALLFVNSFLIGVAVGIHERGLWFPDEDNWLTVGGLYMMAASFVQMVAFMAYKVFFQERLEDQAYVTGLTSTTRRHMKRQNADFQRLQMAMQMEGRKKTMEAAMEKAKMELMTDSGLDDLPDEASFNLTPDLPDSR